MSRAGPAAGGAPGGAALITGGAGGIGLAIALRLQEEGWPVILCDIDEAALEKAQDACGGKARTLALDVSDKDALEAAAQGYDEEGLTVSALVNGAGLLQDVTTLEDLEPERNRRIWEVNYFGALYCTQVFAGRMAARGRGAVVNITSINEQRPLPLYAYAPTKVALGALTQLSAAEYGPSGVRVNAVAPGFTLTPLFKQKIEAGLRSTDALESHCALGRLVEPAEIAAAVAFLLSNDASAITGVSLPVDCGWLARSHHMNFHDLKT